MSDIQKHGNNEVTIQSSQELDRGVHRDGEFTKYSTDQRAQLRALGGLDEASDGDLDMLAAFSDRTGLDPFVKEVYLVGRKTKTGGYRGEPERWETKWTVQTGIDGFRKVTHRVGEAKGLPVQIGRPIFYDSEGNQRKIWLKQWGFPAAAEVEISIGDNTGVGVATWDEFVQTKKGGDPNSMWEKMGPTMLAKCAEAQAHRRVTPLTSGMYVAEEMMHADNVVQAKSTRMDVQRGAEGVRAALAAKREPEPQPEPESSQDDSADYVREVTDHLATLDTQEQVNEFMASLQAQDANLPEGVLAAGRARWEEINA